MTYGVICMYIVFWLILSQSNSLESILIGTAICLVIGLVNKRKFILSIYKKGIKSLSIQMKLWVVYGLALLKEIVLANISVAKVVLSPKITISPEMTTFTTKLNSDFCRTILANSITLTPGTLTVEMEDNKLTVHCLKREYVDGLIDSKFENILLKIEESMNG